MSDRSGAPAVDDGSNGRLHLHGGIGAFPLRPSEHTRRRVPCAPCAPWGDERLIVNRPSLREQTYQHMLTRRSLKRETR